MEFKEATIEIHRKAGLLKSVSVAMPTWDKDENDGSISVNIPLFGLKAFVFDDMDQDVVVNDVIKSFCISAEKFGTGLESELSVLGWEYCEENENKITMSYLVHSKDFVILQ
ncbi:hypothetical protein SAMN05880574_12147 [Chryseobacterium sp. RU37D]|uniref:hypothetical protein n=1 Tax=Chryseobacterium sp. RU37D TaxID=1907397 RepID=UPI0009558EB4|nr:hypothetical protein [Chryseobacterium sp. RU37D]SIQ69879.1 hypothetical protein SAMN05880574_12147 [Chryseobacterium sp. RU37D]